MLMYGSQWGSLAAARSLLFFTTSHDNPYQYYKSRENPYQVLQVTRESVLQVTCAASERAMKSKARMII